MKNKGFTLIELLGVIIILATISLVAFPAILNFMSSSKGEIDKAKETVIVSAAKDYATDTNYTGDICTKYLIEQGYITNKEIEKDNSCVNISNGQYTYQKDCNCN